MEDLVICERSEVHATMGPSKWRFTFDVQKNAADDLQLRAAFTQVIRYTLPEGLTFLVRVTESQDEGSKVTWRGEAPRFVAPPIAAEIAGE